MEEYKTAESKQIIYKEVVNNIITLLKDNSVSVNIEILNVVKSEIKKSSFLKLAI